MTCSIAVYHQTVPNKKNLEKTQMLQFFASGSQLAGAQVTNVFDSQIVNADVAVIQGWVSTDVQRPHLRLRNDVINHQLNSKKYVVTADSNLFLYANTNNPLHYLRYSFNGVFPNTGIYFDTKVDPNRWNKIQRDLGIGLKNYRANGSHILICLQRNGGWSMGNNSVDMWAQQTIRELRKYTSRPIVLRAHPGDQQSHVYLKKLEMLARPLNFIISTNTKLTDDLVNCWAVVNHNSSPAVAAAIEGYPVFVTDPGRSQCQEIANTDLSRIETPNLPDRLPWIQRLSMSHWKFDELKSGEAWRHMQQFVRDIP
jgi:hypothetical protein